MNNDLYLERFRPTDIVSLLDWLDRAEARIREIETLSSTHITWFTHKNPYGCWICDILRLAQEISTEVLNHLSPPLDKHDGRSSTSEESRAEV